MLRSRSRWSWPEVLPRIWERSPEAGRQRLEELRQLARGALAEMRTLLLELRPQALMEAGADELFRQLTEAMGVRTGIAIELEMPAEMALPPDVKTALYRIAQEALNNVSKHANATRATLGLETDDETVTLRVADDGRGFVADQIDPARLGLSIMRERAQQIGATLEIESQPGAGSRATVRWPRKQELAA